MVKFHGWPRGAKRTLVLVIILAVVALGMSVAALSRPAPEAAGQIIPQQLFTSTPTSSSSASKHVTLAEAMRRLEDTSRPFTVVVLGDSTGADAISWPGFVGEWIGETYDRSVLMHPWSEGNNSPGYRKVRQLSTGVNAAVTIFNGSAPNRDAAYSLAEIDKMIPVELATVDLVLISHGHNQPSDSLTPQIHALTSKLLIDAPQASIGLVLQNPQKLDSPHVLEHKSNTESLRLFAEMFDFETINVRQAFLDYGDYASLYKDGVHPAGGEGYRVWADAVISVLAAG